MWYNRQILRSVEILQSTTEFAGLHKSGQDSAFAQVNELIKQLTQHEEDLLKHLMNINWKTGRESHVYRFFDDPYHKLDADDHIRTPVHVPYMMSYFFLLMVSDTTATVKGDDKALHTENTVWTCFQYYTVWLTQPHGRHHKAPPQPCALATRQMAWGSSRVPRHLPSVAKMQKPSSKMVN